jgi:hypothetical protein
MSEVIDLTDYPYQLQDYVSKQHSVCIKANQADRCPTYKSELDQLTQGAIEQYERGLTLIQGMSDQEHGQCRALYHLEHDDNRVNDLRTMEFERVQCLVPAYITLLPKARYLQPYFQ